MGEIPLLPTHVATLIDNAKEILNYMDPVILIVPCSSVFSASGEGWSS
jgi:hypothetical protein